MSQQRPAMLADKSPKGSKKQVRDSTGLMSGLLFIGLGAGFLLIGSGYEFGTARAMGAGFFPSVLAVLLIALGVIVALSSASGSNEALGSVNWRGVILIPLATLTFAILVRSAGIVAAAFISVLIASMATANFNLRQALIVAAAIAAFSTLVFVIGLGLPIPIVGPWLSFA